MKERRKKSNINSQILKHVYMLRLKLLYAHTAAIIDLYSDIFISEIFQGMQTHISSKSSYFLKLRIMTV